MEFTQKDIDRFWSKVDKETTPDGCWNYIGGLNSHGYGVFKLNKKQLYAQRVSYTLKHGPIPKGEGYHGICVCHKCDNPRCCNPDHPIEITKEDKLPEMVRIMAAINLQKHKYLRLEHCQK